MDLVTDVRSMLYYYYLSFVPRNVEYDGSYVCLHTLTVPSALAVTISPASLGWCSVQVITLLWTLGGGFGCRTAACARHQLPDLTLTHDRHVRRPSPKPRLVHFRHHTRRSLLHTRNRRDTDRTYVCAPQTHLRVSLSLHQTVSRASRAWQPGVSSHLPKVRPT